MKGMKCPKNVGSHATLNPPSPRGGTRGTTIRLTLTGTGVGLATEVTFAESGLRATIVKAEKPTANRLDVDLTMAADARVGLHRIEVVTPLGVPVVSQSFAVEAYPAVAERGCGADDRMVLFSRS